MPPTRRYRAGESIEDYCRACKTDRQHAERAADHEGRPIRVVCGYCRSEHNFRGGPRIDLVGRGGAMGRSKPRADAPVPAAYPFPAVIERERTSASMSVDSPDL